MNMKTNRMSIGLCPTKADMKRRVPRLSLKAGAWILTILVLLCGIPVHAGNETSSPLDLKQVAPQVPPTLDEPWKFTLGVPGWLPGIYGDIGVHGITTSVHANISQILPYVDFATSVEAGVQKGKFGVYGSLLYMSLAGDATTDGILAKVDLRTDEYLADFGFSYRLVEGPRGWLDALAGVRYTNLYQRVTLHPNDGAIDSTSAELVDGLSKAIASKLSDRGIGDEAKTLIAQRVLNQLQDLVGEHPVYPIGPVAGSELDRIKDEIRRLVERADPDLAAAILAEAQAKTAALKAAAQQRVDSLKNKLADAIAAKLGSALDQRFTKTNFWFDPYVGLRGRLNLDKAWYLTGRADIGGFGAGSQLTWQVYGALGCQLTRYIYAEAGYRSLYMNYRGGGLIYDTYTRGFQIDMGITF